MKNELYESHISDARWMAYDLPGNAGWIVYLVSLGKQLHAHVTIGAVLACFPALLMLLGIAELIDERIRKLDRVLPKVRLYRGFGALTLGGALGAVLSLADLLFLDGGAQSAWMLAGSVFCALFAWLIFREYRKQRP